MSSCPYSVGARVLWGGRLWTVASKHRMPSGDVLLSLRAADGSILEGVDCADVLPPSDHEAATFFASRGLEGLGSVVRAPVSPERSELLSRMRSATAVDLDAIVDGKVTDDDVGRLKQFEMDHQDEILTTTTRPNEPPKEPPSKPPGQPPAGTGFDSQQAMEEQRLRDQNEDRVVRRFLYWYSAGVTLATFVYIFMVTFKGVPDASKDYANTILGFLLGVTLSAIIQYFFGSSQGSSNKSTQITELTRSIQSMANKG